MPLYHKQLNFTIAQNSMSKSKSQRCPLLFFNILDLVGINAWILYKQMMGEEISRQEFLFQLAEKLGTEYQKERQLSKEWFTKKKNK